MTKTALRLTLTVLALVLTVAGTVNLRRANAGFCDEECACIGGPEVCCVYKDIICYQARVPILD